MIFFIAFPPLVLKTCYSAIYCFLYCHNSSLSTTSITPRIYRPPRQFLYLYLSIFIRPLVALSATRYDTPMDLSAPLFKKIRQSLLRWYSLHRRDLPWRHTRDPYKIWVSEIMLQQTQVATVIPYYRTLACKSLPTLSALAGESTPFKGFEALWAGLGYYRRVRMLPPRGAICSQKSATGEYSSNRREALRELPGIGRYTAGAIASIALGRKNAGTWTGTSSAFFHPDLRHPAERGPHPATLEKLWGPLPLRSFPKGTLAILNQALMELGATVCFPSDPPMCPLPCEENLCGASPESGSELFYPVRSRGRTRYEKLRMATLVLTERIKMKCGSKNSPSRGAGAGLWMFPFWARIRKRWLSEITPLSRFEACAFF